jgi:hypothetical protein
MAIHRMHLEAAEQESVQKIKVRLYEDWLTDMDKKIGRRDEKDCSWYPTDPKYYSAVTRPSLDFSMGADGASRYRYSRPRTGLGDGSLH